ncbi:MAG: GTPase, partial [Moorea sp. SIO2I5]|nr:GTPase [Moorena sp. SIO2I5]
YEIPDYKDRFIAPQLLSYKQPDYNWDPSHNLILRYDYRDFMPKGIITRLIVVMHRYIDQQKYVWKSGVILTKDNTKAEVIEYYGKREIKIRVAGRDKRGLLTIVTHELDKINASYKRLKYSKLIPCNCPTCKDSQSPHSYPFEILLKFIADKQYTIQCQESYHMVNVLSLIDDIIDFKQLISNNQQELNKSVHFKGDILKGDIPKIVFNLFQKDKIYGDYKSMNTNDQSRKFHLSENAVKNSGDGSIIFGDNTGTFTNAINQLPSFDAEPDKKQLKELLSQLHNAVIEEDLDDDDKEEALEQIEAIASALNNYEDSGVKKVVKKAMKILMGTAAALSPTANMVTICKELPALISNIF